MSLSPFPLQRLSSPAAGKFLHCRSKTMCPMRFLLVFFSAVLAGYYAWRTVRSSPDVDADGSVPEDSAVEKKAEKYQGFEFKKMVENGFWVFVDMASGRYLWRNLRSSGESSGECDGDQVKSS